MEAWPSGAMLFVVMEPLLGKRPGGKEKSCHMAAVPNGGQAGVQEFLQSSASSNGTHGHKPR